MMKEESPTWKDPIITGIALEHDLRFCQVNAPGEQCAVTPLPGSDEFVPAHGSGTASEKWVIASDCPRLLDKLGGVSVAGNPAEARACLGKIIATAWSDDVAAVRSTPAAAAFVERPSRFCPSMPCQS